MLTAERLPRSGKVRDLYELPDRHLVLVASDRISAFDVILPTAIPDKGKVLTGMSRFWFDRTCAIVPNHLLATDVETVVDVYAGLLRRHEQDPRAAIPEGGFDAWRGRVMVCRPTAVIPIEAVVRGYLAGSGWKEYQRTGTVCGIKLPSGLRESDRLPEPIFTPASKAPAGEHDQNLSFDAAIEYTARHMFDHGLPAEDLPRDRPLLDRDVAAELVDSLRAASLRLYRSAASIAEDVGLLVADTKFEFGIPKEVDQHAPDLREGQVPDWHETSTRFRVGRGSAEEMILIDEALTPDSSRFWDAATYEPGGPQASFDKQFVRDWLDTRPWDKRAPGPELPPEVVAGTRARYIEAFERITGASFERYLQEDVIAP